MLNKIIHFLIIILFITITLVNSHLLDFFGLSEIGKNFYVNGNYEFSKVIYFNIFSGVILFLYFIKIIINKEKIFIPKIIFLIYLILIFSTIFSISPEISLFGNTDKSHSLLMFLNLIGIFIILINSDYKFKKNLLFWSVLGLFPVIYFTLKEYYNPSFDYGDLGNRAIGTFGHPNYLALYLLLFLPIVLEKKILCFKKINKVALAPCTLNYFLIIGIISAIILTKSVIAICLLILYKIYYFFFRQKYKNIKSLYFIFVLIGIVFFIIQNFGYSKLHSFLSRIYIWETTIDIIFSDIKTFFLGNGLGTLGIIFDSFKSPFLYIFENFGFTADRPHNILLNIFYHTGIFGLLIFLYLIFKLIFKKSGTYKISLVLAFVFLLFNYASIVSYLVIVLFVSLLSNNNNSILNSFSYLRKRVYILNYLVIFLITSFSVFGTYNSYKFYNSEVYLYKGDFIKSQNIYPHNPSFDNKINCENLKIKSIENYFYCGKITWNFEKEKAIKYYKLGLKKLPDLWNKNSKYFDNLFIKDNPDILHRFYSVKYNNLKEILKRVGIKK